jgi:hypothetical protein
MFKLYIKDVLVPIFASLLLTSILVSIFMLLDGNPIGQALSTGFLGTATILGFPILALALIHGIILARNKTPKPKYRAKRIVTTFIIIAIWVSFWFIMGTYVDANSWSGVIIAIFAMFSLFYFISSAIIELVLHFISAKPSDSN